MPVLTDNNEEIDNDTFDNSTAVCFAFSDNIIYITAADALYRTLQQKSP